MANRRMVSHINVTPLVDVMLVLLIIFMVTAPMMKEGIDIDLPEVEAKGLSVGDEPVVVSVDAKGKLYINDTLVEFNSLRPKLAAISKRRKDAMVLLKADSKVPYGTVAQAMAEIRGAGIQKVGMMTSPAPSKRNRR
ncbi:MAG: protein TolR [Thermodesulfobacteriota bacterium]